MNRMQRCVELGRSLLAVHRNTEARDHFLLARDLDAIRFRADTRIVRTIRDVGYRFEPGA